MPRVEGIIPLGLLEPQRRFRYLDTGRTARLLSIGPSGARIVYEGATRRVRFQVTDAEGAKREVAFRALGKPVIVSADSLVEPLPEEPPNE